jgi:hypothetical protein
VTYSTIATIQEDFTLRRRLNACAAAEDIENPEQWVVDNSWKLAVQPGWAAAWESALASGVESPGRREDVITDGMILSAVQAIQA